MTPEALQDKLAAVMPDCELQVTGDGNHFDLQIVGDCFEGLSRVRRQQLVYRNLGDLISSGEVHAVVIHAKTFAEANAG